MSKERCAAVPLPHPASGAARRGWIMPSSCPLPANMSCTPEKPLPLLSSLPPCGWDDCFALIHLPLSLRPLLGPVHQGLWEWRQKQRSVWRKFLLQLLLAVNRASIGYKGDFSSFLSPLSRRVHQSWQFFIQSWTTSGITDSNTALGQHPMTGGPPLPLCTHYPQISTATAEQCGGSSALRPAAISCRFCLGAQLSCAAPATLKLARYRPLSFRLLSISLNLGKASTSGRISAGVPEKRDMQMLHSLWGTDASYSLPLAMKWPSFVLSWHSLFSFTAPAPLKALLHKTCYGLLPHQLPTCRAVMFHLCICTFASTSSLPTCSVLQLLITAFPTS